MTRPPASAPRLLCQGLLPGGGFTAVIREGTWCRAEPSGQGLAGLRLEATALDAALSLEARFTDGGTCYATGQVVACEARGGGLLQAFRVRLF